MMWCSCQQPDLILLSAGFDGSAKDIGNQKHTAASVQQGMNLQRKDYLWMTQEIRRIAGTVYIASFHPWI